MQKYLNNSEAEVTFIEHNDFVLVCSVVEYMTAVQIHKQQSLKLTTTEIITKWSTLF